MVNLPFAMFSLESNNQHIENFTASCSLRFLGVKAAPALAAPKSCGCPSKRTRKNLPNCKVAHPVSSVKACPDCWACTRNLLITLLLITTTTRVAAIITIPVIILIAPASPDNLQYLSAMASFRTCRYQNANASQRIRRQNCQMVIWATIKSSSRRNWAPPRIRFPILGSTRAAHFLLSGQKLSQVSEKFGVGRLSSSIDNRLELSGVIFYTRHPLYGFQFVAWFFVHRGRGGGRG